jgi:hypothetical protein
MYIKNPIFTNIYLVNIHYTIQRHKNKSHTLRLECGIVYSYLELVSICVFFRNGYRVSIQATYRQ